MKVLFVAAEGLPYIKSGGLADVIGSLPNSIASSKIKVDVILPLYSAIINKYMKKLEYVRTIDVNQGIFGEKVRIFQHTINKITTYFVENQRFFERNEMYGYADDGARFAFFQHTVMNFILASDGDYDLVHCHDWHTGMIPVLGRTLYQWHKKISHLKYIYTIHNLAYQGNFPTSVLTDCFGLTLDLMADNSVNFHDGMSFMKGGIFYSDRVTTVSKTYSKEILTKEFGEQMEYVLQLKKGVLSGIVNGIDTKMWNPASDKIIAKKYNINTLENKSLNKTTLQQEYGLKVDKNIPLIAIVSRLTNQKGIDLVVDKINEITNLPIQFFILGSGDEQFENQLKYYEFKNKNFVFYKGYSESLAHQIYAASDLFLMPSYFEPCGISQLISMHYGSLPIVRETGGLKDTVKPYNKYTSEGTGFTFARFDSFDMFECIKRAVELYQNEQEFKKLQINAMNEKVGWLESAREYRKLYRELLK